MVALRADRVKVLHFQRRAAVDRGAWAERGQAGLCATRLQGRRSNAGGAGALVAGVPAYPKLGGDFVVAVKAVRVALGERGGGASVAVAGHADIRLWVQRPRGCGVG